MSEPTTGTAAATGFAGGADVPRPAGGDALLLGVDTGGTYTDAALLDAARLPEGAAAVIAKAKALTTRDDLGRGIAAAVDAVLAAGHVPPGRIGLVSLSTTLATNALVEGQGGRAALIMIGFDPADLGRQGLAEAIGQDPLIAVAGGHDPHGTERAPLDREGLAAALDGLAVEAVAICGHFGVRNPAHELAARDIVRALTGLPVTCSHELSAQVGGPRRALTALLNARLVGMIAGLVASAEAMMAARGIAAPLMVVRGDGALVSAEFARLRPIETILSGPAASLVGASFLTGLGDAIVSDIGGTTTDIAVLHGGRPRLDPAGAEVGGLRTMVEAVAMTTHGLGGDSEVALDERQTGAAVLLGPRRLVPLALLGAEHGAAVPAALERQLSRAVPGELDGRFLLRVGPAEAPGLGPAEAALLASLDAAPVAADEALRTRPRRIALKRLVERGLVRVAGFTPSDAAHVVGLHAGWDARSAELGAALMARRRGVDGRPVAADGLVLARAVIEALIARSAEHVLDAAFAADGFGEPGLARATLAQAALRRHAGLVCPRLSLSVPLVGLGASAPVYYPRVAEMLDAPPVIPGHADVANAVGAVAGQVRITRQATLTQPAEDRFRLHLAAGTRDFAGFEDARRAAETALEAEVRAAATLAGAAEVALTRRWEVREAEIEGRRVIVEAELIATATGRPRIAAGFAPPGLPPGFAGL
ncbi:hydantoinase/oxoprolinase family protein [Limibaculum sp. FT325]|uniref:hydantoinase/oxoprolinase family protein n=1 Tax=Thermohalobaculum sediminis TaxID=2939436 RepID=UPI0020C15155|nr:hydantoinase/oxoprolinase family protein [Limibaculum sediminis]MCL5777418.1 hydantoinase/oxoprolinase family protein [Limibaculum sediminis]